MKCVCNKAEYRKKSREIAKNDPTRTLALRNRFVREMEKRFAYVKRMILEEVGRKDMFAIGRPSVVQNARIDRNTQVFTKSDRKIEDFGKWVDQMVQEGVLTAYHGPQRMITSTGRWTDIYVQSAYKAGLARAEKEMKRSGMKGTLQEGKFISSLWELPVHSDRIAILYGRAYENLKGITREMGTKMSQTFAQGMADGEGPMAMARDLVKQIDIPRNRANMIARTETIRAHHEGLVNSYREAGVYGVTVMAEWSTAGDDRVCERCDDLQGKIFTLDAIQNLIPLHPQCRCVALPVVDEDRMKDAIDVDEAEKYA